MSEQLNINSKDNKQSLPDWEDIIKFSDHESTAQLKEAIDFDNKTDTKVEQTGETDIQNLAANLLRLIETGNQEAATDYIFEVLSNQVEAPVAEKRAILEFLIEKQREKLCNNISNQHGEMVDTLELQAKQRFGQLMDYASQMVQLGRAIDDETLARVTSKYRGGGNISLAMRGYEDVLPIIKRERFVAEEYEESWNGVQRFQRETIVDYASGLRHNADVEHLDALDSAKYVISSDESLAERDMSKLIEPEVVNEAIEFLKEKIAEAKEQQASPEQAIAESLGSNPKIDSEQLIESIQSFTEIFEELVSDKRIRYEASQLVEMCGVLYKNAQMAIEPRLDADTAQYINRKQSEIINNIAQITRKIASLTDGMLDQQVGLLRASKLKAQPENKYASAFK